MNNGDKVSATSIHEMLSKPKSEYGLAYKLNDTHLGLTGQERQRVKYAAQLLSRSCVNSHRHSEEKGLLESRNWKETSDFIFLIDELFAIINSCHMYGNIQTRNAFGIDINKQINILAKVAALMSDMKVKSPKTRSHYKFQKGVMFSSQSLIGLYNMLKPSYEIDYIMTTRLNQDCLEHFFACIRQMSRPHDHPNAVSFKYRLVTLVGKRHFSNR